MPEVTVLMPVYNGMPFLPEAVDSIRKQTLRDFTFLIINDGSTDDTGEYVFYNVPPGTYRIAVTARDYTDTLWSSNFDVVAQDVNVPDILMTGFIGAPGSISGTAMPWIPLLLLDE